MELITGVKFHGFQPNTTAAKWSHTVEIQYLNQFSMDLSGILTAYLEETSIADST